MVVRAGIGHAEAQRDHVQETRLLGLDTLGTQVVPGMEDQFVLAGSERLALEDRRIAAAVVVGDDLVQANALLALQAKDLDADTFARSPLGGVEYVGSQASHGGCSSCRVVDCRDRTGCRSMKTVLAILAIHFKTFFVYI